MRHMVASEFCERTAIQYYFFFSFYRVEQRFQYKSKHVSRICTVEREHTKGIGDDTIGETMTIYQYIGCVSIHVQTYSQLTRRSF